MLMRFITRHEDAEHLHESVLVSRSCLLMRFVTRHEDAEHLPKSVLVSGSCLALGYSPLSMMTT